MGVVVSTQLFNTWLERRQWCVLFSSLPTSFRRPKTGRYNSTTLCTHHYQFLPNFRGKCLPNMSIYSIPNLCQIMFRISPPLCPLLLSFSMYVIKITQWYIFHWYIGGCDSPWSQCLHYQFKLSLYRTITPWSQTSNKVGLVISLTPYVRAPKLVDILIPNFFTNIAWIVIDFRSFYC